jgi:hypothetical protein
VCDDIQVTESNLVRTAVAAAAVGVLPETLLRWAYENPPRVRYEYLTPGGQARWSIDHLRAQLGITPPPGESDEAD